MKNVHLLPVEKPSRLGYLTRKGKEVFNNLVLFDMLMPNILDSENQNIYITNEEEIKFDDYYLGEDNNLYCLVTKVNSNGKKIILTTDHELIEEGIQAIDDEFLEWFVKNPSCEETEVIYGLFNTAGRQVDPNNSGQNHSQCVWRYKIIIPKEDPKQETLEEVVNAFKKTDVYINEIKQKQERMYSEIDLEVAFFEGRENSLTFIEWFEQFKKK
jgi:hypothetical protein